MAVATDRTGPRSTLFFIIPYRIRHWMGRTDCPCLVGYCLIVLMESGRSVDGGCGRGIKLAHFMPCMNARGGM